jgi:hypothetical protein
MPGSERWVCKVCWKSNHRDAVACWKCRAPRDVDDTTVEQHRVELEAKANRPEAVPDIVVALPVVIYRSYAKVWLRGGLGSLLLPVLLAFGGLTDVTLLLLTGGLAAGLVIFGFLAGEVADGMRDREVWAFVMGALLAVVGSIGSVVAIETFAPGLLPPTAIRWSSIVVFGGAGLAAVAGLVLMYVRREA